MLEIASRDEVTLRMRGEPALAVVKQFCHLIITDPIMLVVIKDRNEHVKMRQQLMQRQSPFQGHTEIRAVTPVGKLVIQRMALGSDGVAQRFEQTAEKFFATTTWKH